MTFADVIRQRVKSGMQNDETDGGRFRQVLDELAAGLTSEDVCAEIIRGGVGGRLYLTLWPRSRPSSRNLMLAFWVTESTIRVFTNPAQEIEDVDGLQRCLEEFVSSPPFLESLRLLEMVNRQPAEAYLRAHSAGNVSGNDVSVAIASDAQRALVEQPDGAEIDILVGISELAGAARFDPRRTYPALESSGTRIDVTRIEAVGDRELRIQGTKHKEPDPDEAFEAFDEEVENRMKARRDRR